jgi:hypothetical protein
MRSTKYIGNKLKKVTYLTMDLNLCAKLSNSVQLTYSGALNNFQIAFLLALFERLREQRDLLL